MRNSGKFGNILIALLMVASLTIAGCGGGGGTAQMAEEPPPPMPSAEEVACGGGPSEACVAYHTANVAEVEGNPDATLGELQAAQAALAAAQGDLAAANMAAHEAEVAACEGAGGRFNDDGTCSSAEDLAAEQAAADLEQAKIDAGASAVSAREAMSATIDELALGVDAAAANQDADPASYARAEDALKDARNSYSRAVDAINTIADAETVEEVNAISAQIASLFADAGASVDAANAFLVMVAEAQSDIDMAAATARGEALYPAFAGPNVPSNARDNLPAANVNLSPAGLAITAADGAGTTTAGNTDVNPKTLNAGDAVPTQGIWTGNMYLAGNDSAVVYTNQDAPTLLTFAAAGHIVAVADGATAIKGYLDLNEGDAPTRALIRADAFNHHGERTHPVPDGDAVYIPGTFEGARGVYRCSANCTSRNNGSGAPVALGGEWHFKPEENAMVIRPDADYLMFGWWLRTDANGVPTIASSFARMIGAGAVITTGVAGNDPSLPGSATFIGKAAGQFATQNFIDGTKNDGGTFTADVELNAAFGTVAGPTVGMTGTINNFRLNGGSEDPNWSVSLANAPWAAAGVFTGAANSTTWTIDGVDAAASGNWAGQMYDDAPPAAANDDNSNVPTAAMGSFYSEYSDRGRMVGAFGTKRTQ